MNMRLLLKYNILTKILLSKNGNEVTVKMNRATDFACSTKAISNLKRSPICILTNSNAHTQQMANRFT